jgi:TatA/E family protein of Tat protein translocase
MGPLGLPEMIFLGILALLILGPRKLPELGRSLGKGMAEFRRASNELRNTFEREMSTVEQEGQEIRSATRSLEGSAAPPAANSADNVYGDAAYPYYDETTSSDSATEAAEAQPAPVSGDSLSPAHADQTPVKESEVKT